MNRVEQFRQLIGLSGVLLVAYAIARLLNQHSVAAQDLDDLCYMKTSDGRITSLNSLCGGGNNTYDRAGLLSTVDKQFIQSYQDFVKTNLNTSSSATTELAQLEKNPEAVINRAKAVCEAKNGSSTQPLQDQRTTDADLIETLAVDYYCPERDD